MIHQIPILYSIFLPRYNESSSSMTLLQRRILYLSFFLLFFIAAPLVLFYSLGFDYNPKKKAVVLQGGLYLEFIPKDATVVIDEKHYQQKSPLNLTRLLPGVYSVRVLKEQYHPWQKLIRILPQETKTFVIHLFPTQLPMKVPAPPPQTEEQRMDLTHFTLTPIMDSVLITSYSSGATTTLPRNRASYFEYKNVPVLFVYQQQTKKLTLIPDGTKKLESEHFENIQGIKKINDVMILWSDFEIWVWDTPSARRELITRVSERIADVTLYKKQYLLYATVQGNIVAIELNDYFGRMATQLTSFSSAETFQLVEDSLLVKGSISKEKGWWQMNLK